MPSLRNIILSVSTLVAPMGCYDSDIEKAKVYEELEVAVITNYDGTKLTVDKIREESYVCSLQINEIYIQDAGCNASVESVSFPELKVPTAYNFNENLLKDKPMIFEPIVKTPRVRRDELSFEEVKLLDNMLRFYEDRLEAQNYIGKLAKLNQE